MYYVLLILVKVLSWSKFSLGFTILMIDGPNIIDKQSLVCELKLDHGDSHPRRPRGGSRGGREIGAGGKTTTEEASGGDKGEGIRAPVVRPPRELVPLGLRRWVMGRCEEKRLADVSSVSLSSECSKAFHHTDELLKDNSVFLPHTSKQSNLFCCNLATH